MSQSSPTPDPVAWMVLNPRGEMVAFSPASEEDCREFVSGYPGARLVPLYDHPSALPATTPSDPPEGVAFWVRDEADRLMLAIDSQGEIVTEHMEVTKRQYRDLLRHVVQAWAARVSPSEGSAPDTPAPEDDDDLADQVALQVLCRVFDDGVDVAMDEWRAFNAEGGFFWWARALGAFIRGRLDDQRVPPSAPDTKPDEVVPFCAICGKRATQRDIDGNWWPPCEHAKTAGLQTFVYPGPWRTNVNDWKHWALGHGQPELASGVAQVFALDLISAKAEINRLSSSPPEGEDTTRLGDQ